MISLQRERKMKVKMLYIQRWVNKPIITAGGWQGAQLSGGGPARGERRSYLTDIPLWEKKRRRKE